MKKENPEPRFGFDFQAGGRWWRVETGHPCHRVRYVPHPNPKSGSPALECKQHYVLYYRIQSLDDARQSFPVTVWAAEKPTTPLEAFDRFSIMLDMWCEGYAYGLDYLLLILYHENTRRTRRIFAQAKREAARFQRRLGIDFQEFAGAVDLICHLETITEKDLNQFVR